MATVATMTDTAPLATTETATVALLLLAAVTESVTFRLLLVAGATTMCAGAMTVTVARLPVASATERCSPFACPMLCMSVWRFRLARLSRSYLLWHPFCPSNQSPSYPFWEWSARQQLALVGDVAIERAPRSRAASTSS